MPHRMHLGADDLIRCRFAISPLWETQEAVRTLTSPQRQSYHLPWLRGIRSAAAGLDLLPLRLLMPRSGFTPDFLCPPPADPLPTIEEELARARAGDPARARAEMERSLADTPGALSHPRARRMLADPAQAVRDLADLLELAWKALIAPHWPRLRALLEADVAFHSRRLADGGLEGLFAELHPSLAYADGTLTVDGRGNGARVLAGEGLLLVPSVFCWPDVITGFDPPWQPSVVYPARGVGGLWTGPSDGAPRALARLLGKGRAAVLTALTEPATTTALAQRLGLAPSSVSAHLSALRDAGLLTSHRYGHQVLYERTPLGIALAGG